MARLIIDSATKFFGNFCALDSLSFTVEDGEFIAVLGPSGCGKTTLLRLIAGFDQLNSGTISVGDKVLSGQGKHMPPEERRLGIVFQSYALWPHMNVADNVAYALKVQGVATEARNKRVAAALETVGLKGFAERRPALLSGGERQRVALARCLAVEPTLVLLDEPLANLDAHLRSSMEQEFSSFHKRTGTTMFYITHDQAEAMALADRIAVMDQGKLLQLATPSVLYREPANTKVARFIGEGMVFPVTVQGAAQEGHVHVTVFGQPAIVRCGPRNTFTKTGEICVRAGDIEIVPHSLKPEHFVAAHLTRLIYQGGRYRGEATLDASPDTIVTLDIPEPAGIDVGDAVRLVISTGWFFPENPQL
jgi:iron(III) transport system ATP-binding protein